MPATSKLEAARAVGLGAPAAAVASLLTVLLLVATLATGGRGTWLIDSGERFVADMAERFGGAQGDLGGRFANLGFRVAEVHLQGASRASQDEILREAAIKPGAPILDLDLNAIRARVERVAWVEHARVMRLLPDVLVIAVEQRPLMAVWQHQGRLDVIATNGRVTTNVDPSRFPGLPRVIGEGANTEAASLLSVLAKQPGLVTRLLAVRRVDERRWDLLLKDGAVVLLPAENEAAAIARLTRLDHASHILDLGLERIDLRSADFTVVRKKAGVAPVEASKGV